MATSTFLRTSPAVPLGGRRPHSRLARAAAKYLLGGLPLLGCEPPLDVGSWRCAAAPLFIPPDGSPMLPGRELPVTTGWSTSFEDGFCGYSEATGFCYADADATHRLVEFPKHSGRRAAAFDITTEGGKNGGQTRCVREGLLPEEAVYGAWFYIPSGTTSNGNWNLMHFQGSDGELLHGIWDVSVSTRDGTLRPFVRGTRGINVLNPDDDVTLPTDEWFSLHFRLRRDATPAGHVALYLNRVLIIEQRDIVTDDSLWGQWYVGNLADNLDPPQSTIYLDDVSIGETLADTL